MNRDTSVTVTRDIHRDRRDKTSVTFAVSHGTPSRPVPTQYLLKSVDRPTLVCGQLSLADLNKNPQVSQRAREANR